LSWCLQLIFAHLVGTWKNTRYSEFQTCSTSFSAILPISGRTMLMNSWNLNRRSQVRSLLVHGRFVSPLLFLEARATKFRKVSALSCSPNDLSTTFVGSPFSFIKEPSLR
jgi:hypothetical protein